MKVQETAWFVAWQCGCADAQLGREAIPARCPGHNKARIEHPELIERYDGAPVVLGHLCPDRAACRTVNP